MGWKRLIWKYKWLSIDSLTLWWYTDDFLIVPKYRIQIRAPLDQNWYAGLFHSTSPHHHSICYSSYHIQLGVMFSQAIFQSCSELLQCSVLLVEALFFCMYVPCMPHCAKGKSILVVADGIWLAFVLSNDNWDTCILGCLCHV